MSQAGIVDIEGSHPQIPTSFVTNSGTAIPIGNTLEILGTIVAAHSIPLETTGSGNTVTVVTQYASAIAATDGTKVGLASFNSAQFSVDASGFVSFTGTGAGETITGDTGGPLSPISGNWNIFGSSALAGITPVTTSGSGNTLTTKVQISQAIASTDATKVGLSAFDSTQFTVDANGFVSLVGGGTSAVLGLVPDAHTAPGTTPVVPNGSGNIIFQGTSTAAGSIPVQTNSLAANTVAVQVQKTQAIVSTDATKVGLAAFDSARFSVDANGFVTLGGTGVGETITGDTGGALLPTSGNWNIFGGTSLAGSTPIATAGSGSTLKVNAQLSQAIASTDATKVGLAAFSNAEFVVDANGFVTLKGGTTAAVLGLVPDAHTAPGTTPVLPNSSGNIVFQGTSTAAGAVPVQTNSLAANTVAVQVQKSQAIASTNAANVGLSAFDSASFTVDANGFVQLVGDSAAILKVNVQTGTSPIVPSSGAITINGAKVAAGTNPVRTDGTGANTFAVEVQTSQAIASTDATKIGLSNYSSAQFAVDANGFVTLAGGSTAPVLGIVPDAHTAPGTSPVIPNGSGNITFTGSTVAAGIIPVQTNSLAANTVAIQVQKSQAIAAADTTKIGLSNFNSTQFSVDSTGFVTSNNFTITAGTGLTGGGTITLGGTVSLAVSGTGVGETITGNSGGALSPTGGNWNILGATVASGTSPLVTAGSGSTLTINAQRSQALASADSTKVGLSNFSSANFAVDANGFVTLVAGAFNYTNVNHAASPYTVLAADYYISVDCSGGVVTLKFPDAPTANREWIIKDRTGSASTSNISITTVTGTVTFDGQTTYTMDSNYSAINLLANATPTYEVY